MDSLNPFHDILSTFPASHFKRPHSVSVKLLIVQPSSQQNKQLSCRKETVRLLCKPKVIGRRYFADIIIGLSSTTVTQSACKDIEFGKITQNEGYCAVQGHWRSPILIPIESPYATSYQWLIHISYRFKIIADYRLNFGHCVFNTPFGGLGATYTVQLGLIGKLIVMVDFIFVSIKLFFAVRRYERYGLKIGVFAPTGSVWPKISGRRGRPPPTILLVKK